MSQWLHRVRLAVSDQLPRRAVLTTFAAATTLWVSAVLFGWVLSGDWRPPLSGWRLAGFLLVPVLTLLLGAVPVILRRRSGPFRGAALVVAAIFVGASLVTLWVLGVWLIPGVLWLAAGLSSADKTWSTKWVAVVGVMCLYLLGYWLVTAG